MDGPTVPARGPAPDARARAALLPVALVEQHRRDGALRRRGRERGLAGRRPARPTGRLRRADGAGPPRPPRPPRGRAGAAAAGAGRLAGRAHAGALRRAWRRPGHPDHTARQRPGAAALRAVRVPADPLPAYHLRTLARPAEGPHALKVLMLSWEYPPHNVGGLGKHVMELVPALARAGVEVHLITPRWLGGAGEEAIQETVVDPAHPEPAPATVYRVPPPEVDRADFFTNAWRTNVVIEEHGRTLLDGGGYDLIHA